jgi:UDP-N-acetylmuramoyl-tripeptide--D-alanyl-D-alanine ligase
VSAESIALIITGAALFTAYALATGYDFINHMQLCGYRAGEYFRRIDDEKVFGAAALSLACVCVQVIVDALPVDAPLWIIGGYALCGAFTAAYYLRRVRRARKTPTVFTPRMIRLYVTITALALIVGGGTLTVTALYFAYAQTALAGLIILLIIPITALAACVNMPLEKLNNYRYLRRAKRRLAEIPDLKIIGITGSFGKTSLKSILYDILSKNYQALATPASYNTPMGITKNINTRLLDTHRIFIVEMGARRIGDIKELCALARPDIAVITAVGSQHLATFGSIENTASAKYEIVKYAKEGAFAAFNGDNVGSKALYDITGIPKILAAQAARDGQKTAFYSDVLCSERGSVFTLGFGDGTRFRAETILLGEHNISNITLAAAIAYKLGMPAADIVNAISQIRPIPHRLQLLPTARHNLTIIDDSYNACPESAAAAFNVVRMFSGERVIITPGLVELGETQAYENTGMGRRMAEVFDYCFVTGRNSKYLTEGLLSAGFGSGRVFETVSTAAAVEKLHSLGLGKTVLLFENDLPDNY